MILFSRNNYREVSETEKTFSSFRKFGRKLKKHFSLFESLKEVQEDRCKKKKKNCRKSDDPPQGRQNKNKKCFFVSN